jgi:hypothetical protein
MDLLTLFGALAVSAMMVLYALEDRGAGYVLAFAGACVLASAYGFLQGAWPFGVVEAVWALVARALAPKAQSLNSTSQGHQPTILNPSGDARLLRLQSRLRRTRQICN